MDGKKLRGAALGLLAAVLLTTSALAAAPTSLVPVGNAVGIELRIDGVMIAGLTAVETEGGTASPAQDAGLLAGDVITAVGGRSIRSAQEFLTAAEKFDGGPVDVTVKRAGRALNYTVTPAKNSAGAYQLGLWLRDGVNGIGTMTYYDPESGEYGALGHGISDPDTGELIGSDSGAITRAEIDSVLKGAAGTPGELRGQIDFDAPIGTIDENTDGGIFGSVSAEIAGEPVPVAAESEIALGPATILATVSEKGVQEFGIEISRVYRGTGDSRSMMLTVTDPDLLAATGGIVQGMSGSPILQNGKLIGAVTHVLVSDPTRGYGISIEDMLSASAGTAGRAA